MILYYNVVSRSFDQAARYFKSLRLFLFTGTVDIPVPIQLLFKCPQNNKHWLLFPWMRDSTCISVFYT